MAKPKHKDNIVPLEPKKRPIRGITSNQKQLVDAIDNTEVEHIILTGPAGTGKSFISFGKAADWYLKAASNKIVIARPMVPNGDDIGHLPGTEQEKTEPWAKRPLEIIGDRIGKGKLQCDLRKGNIEVGVLQMMQGASYDNCWIIVDEAQEMTVSQARMLVTRTGVNCKLIINGDIKQCNLDEESGLAYLLKHLKSEKPDNIKVIEFDIEDCQRSDVCRWWIERFD